MFRRTSMSAPVAVLLLWAAQAGADLIQFQWQDFGVLAGDNLSVGKAAEITGRIGALDDVWLAQRTIITGDVYAADDLSAGKASQISGSLMAGDSISLGRNVRAGRLDAGATGSSRRITVGRDSVVGEVRAGRDVSLGRGVNVLAAVHAGESFSAGADATIAGAVRAADRVTLGRSVTVGEVHAGGRSLHVGRDSTTGSLYGARDVDIGRGATVQGDVHAADDVNVNRDAAVQGGVVYADRFWQHNSAAVSGQIVQGTADAPMAPLGPDGWALIGAAPGEGLDFSYGREHQRIGARQSVSIEAGEYRDLTAGRRATLNLTAGEYSFRNVSMGGGGTIVADTTAGDVVVKSAKNIALADGVRVEVLGGGKVWLYGAKDISIGAGSSVKANLLALDDVWIDSNTSIEGSIFASDEIGLGSYVVVLAGGAQAPEPGTLALLGLGGTLLLFRRRRRAARA